MGLCSRCELGAVEQSGAKLVDNLSALMEIGGKIFSLVAVPLPSLVRPATPVASRSQSARWRSQTDPQAARAASPNRLPWHHMDEVQVAGAPVVPVTHG